MIFVIDKKRRVYSEMPLQALGSRPAQQAHVDAILTKTGKIRVVADQPRQEYRAVGGNKLEHVAISACVSTSVPGAKEISDFNRKMITRLGDRMTKGSSRSGAAGLMLEKQSVLKFRLPDPVRADGHYTASLIARTRVNKIRLTPLPPETFLPPVGYAKLQNPPQRTVPADSVGSEQA